MKNKILVCGAGGFIGTHLVEKLKQEGHHVIGADIKYPQWSTSPADQFIITDLTDYNNVYRLLEDQNINQIYQLAADMGGAGYIFTGTNDADIMTNSLMINLNICKAMIATGVKKVLFTSSACVYPQHLQNETTSKDLCEYQAYPADPDSDYGWEKLTSERLYASYARNYNLDVRVVRLHNVFGPLGTYDGGKEKAPAALCRKVALAIKNNTSVEIWGTGQQVRSFLYIDECITGLLKINESEHQKPINLGSERCISINDLAHLIAKIAGQPITIENIIGPTGVAGRSSNNALIKSVCSWKPDENLEFGLAQTYKWIVGKLGEAENEIRS